MIVSVTHIESTSLWTMLIVSPSGCSIIKLLGEPTREQATYNWPCEKQSLRRSIPANCNDWPWALLIDMAKHSFNGNCNRLKAMGYSEGVSGIRGIRTCSPLAQPVIIVAPTVYVFREVTRSLVPLHSCGGLRFLKRIIGAPTFNLSSCCGIPGTVRLFKTSIGYLTVSSLSITVFIDLYVRSIELNLVRRKILIWSTCSFLGVRLARSLNHADDFKCILCKSVEISCSPFFNDVGPRTSCKSKRR